MFEYLMKINISEQQINIEVNAIAQSVRIRADQANEKVQALERELGELEKRQLEFQQKNIQYTILKREVDSNRAQYDSLIGKLNELGVGSDLRSSNASIIDKAVLPTSAYSPNLRINLLGGVFVFGMFAAGTIFVLQLLNNTFAGPDQIEQELKLSVLGVIPKMAEEKIAEELENPTSSLSEAYRTLRTSLQFAGTDSGLKSLVITSSEPSEGKSTTATRLAYDFAELNKKVLLIDADLRKPKLHRLMKTDNAIGLSNLLTNVVTSGNIEGIFQRTDHPNLTFMSSGTIPPNPANILMSPKMGLMLQFCKKRYDLIIIDCPPVIGLSDAPILARQADASILIVAAKQASRKSAANAIKRLKSSGANLIGAAMTKFAVDNLDYNYAYRYMQYNYYTYSDSKPDDLQLQFDGDDHNNGGTSGWTERIKASVPGLFDRLAGRSG